MDQDRLVLIVAGARHVVDLGPPDKAVKRIEGAELNADGTLAVFNGPSQLEYSGDSSGAWVVRTDHPEQLFSLPTHCTWAGTAPDGRQVMTIFNGRLSFWEETPAADGHLAFKPTGRILAQAGMKSAVCSTGGSCLATRSADGEVIVWDTHTWLPIQRFESDPERYMGAENDCAPALSHDGRRLAAPYEKAFVVWDVATGKRLGDPIACGAPITKLAFAGSSSAQVEATVSADWSPERRTQRRTLTWDYADVTESRDGKGVKELGELAEMVAAGDWVAKAPELTAKAKDCPRIIAALLQHFATQARTLQNGESQAGETPRSAQQQPPTPAAP
jgi:WD40 repeat protein